jgi:hypothetical protein
MEVRGLAGKGDLAQHGCADMGFKCWKHFVIYDFNFYVARSLLPGIYTFCPLRNDLVFHPRLPFNISLVLLRLQKRRTRG